MSNQERSSNLSKRLIWPPDKGLKEGRDRHTLICEVTKELPDFISPQQLADIYGTSDPTGLRKLARKWNCLVIIEGDEYIEMPKLCRRTVWEFYTGSPEVRMENETYIYSCVDKQVIS